MVKHGKEWLYRTPKPTFWRATTDNDRGNGFPFRAGMWMTADMFQKCVDIQVRIDGTKIEKPSAPVNNKYSDKETAERVEVIFTYETLTVPSTQVKVSYLVFADGNVRVRAHYYGKEGLPELPAFGIRFIIPTEADGFVYEAYRARLIRTEKPEEFMVSMRWKVCRSHHIWFRRNVECMWIPNG